MEEEKPSQCVLDVKWRDPKKSLSCVGNETEDGKKQSASFTLKVDAFDQWKFDGNRYVAGAIPGGTMGGTHIIMFLPPKEGGDVGIGGPTSFGSPFGGANLDRGELKMQSEGGRYQGRALCHPTS